MEAISPRTEWFQAVVKMLNASMVDTGPKVKPCRTPLVMYRRKVLRLTEKQPLHLVPGIELRGKAWHLDHVLSVAEGFVLGLAPEVVAHVSNLRMMAASKNIIKGKRTVYTNLFNED